METRSSFIRLLALCLALLLGAAVFIFYQASYKAGEELVREFDAREAKTLDMVLWLVQSRAPYQGIDPLRDLAGELSRRFGVRVTYVEGGKVLAESALGPAETDKMDDHSQRPEIADARKSGFGKFVRYSTTLQTTLCYMAKPVSGVPGLPDGVLRIAVPYTTVQKVLDESRSQFLAVVAAMAACAAALAVFVILRARGMLRSFSMAVDDLGREQAPDKIRVCPGSEFKPLVDSINVLAKRARKNIRRLQDTRSQFEAVLANMADAVAVLDKDGTIIMHNAALETLLGVGPQSCTGRHVLESGLGVDVFRAVSEALDAGGSGPPRFQARLATGRDADVDLVPYLTARGKRRVILVLHDVTAMKNAERILREFVIDASHQLRTPLTSIQGYASTLMDAPPGDPVQAKSMLATILKKSQDMGSVVTALLGKASPQADDAPPKQ